MAQGYRERCVEKMMQVALGTASEIKDTESDAMKAAKDAVRVVLLEYELPMPLAITFGVQRDRRVVLTYEDGHFVQLDDSTWQFEWLYTSNCVRLQLPADVDLARCTIRGKYKPMEEVD